MAINLTYPIGFFASWNSFSTLSTSGMTFMSAPEVAKSQLEARVMYGIKTLKKYGFSILFTGS